MKVELEILETEDGREIPIMKVPAEVLVDERQADWLRRYFWLVRQDPKNVPYLKQ